MTSDNANEEVLKVFLNSCDSPDIKNIYDESPLHIGIFLNLTAKFQASHLGDLSKISLLLDYKSDPNLKGKNEA